MTSVLQETGKEEKTIKGSVRVFKLDHKAGLFSSNEKMQSLDLARFLHCTALGFLFTPSVVDSRVVVPVFFPLHLCILPASLMPTGLHSSYEDVPDHLRMCVLYR